MLSVHEMDCQYGMETLLLNILWRESKRKIEYVVRVKVKALRASKEQEETVFCAKRKYCHLSDHAVKCMCSVSHRKKVIKKYDVRLSRN